MEGCFCITEKTKQNSQSNLALDNCVYAPRVEDTIDGGYKSASWTEFNRE